MKKVLLIFISALIILSSSVYATAKSSYKLGDVNQDGNINIMDATQIQSYLVELYEGNDEFIKLADVDGDKKVSVIDATYIQLYLSEIIETFPGEEVEPSIKTTDSDGYYDQIVKP